MKALLICPGERPGVAHLAENVPLVIAPLLGKSILEYWLEDLVARGIRHVTLFASDRPYQVRATLGDGARWGVTFDFITQSHEPTVDQVRAKFRSTADATSLADDEIVLLDHLPGQPATKIFESYETWFAAVRAFLPRAALPARESIALSH